MSEPTSGGNQPHDPDKDQHPDQHPDQDQDKVQDKDQDSGSVFNDPTAPVWADPTRPVPSTPPVPPTPPAPPAPQATPPTPPPAPPVSNPYAQQPPAQPYGQATPQYGQPGQYGQPAGQYGQPQPGQQYPAYGQQSYATGPPTESNASAIVLTIVSGLTMLSTCFVIGIPSLIFGIMALSSNSTDPAGSRKKAKTGWIVFGINAGLVVGIGILGIVLLAITGTSSNSDFNF